ncbi:hypothetical protein Tco_0916132, partial [Tanacetum coccineum]
MCPTRSTQMRGVTDNHRVDRTVLLRALRLQENNGKLAIFKGSPVRDVNDQGTEHGTSATIWEGYIDFESDPWPHISATAKKMSFRNFMYAENDDDLSFLSKEPSADFGTGSPSVSINTEPPVVEVVPTDEPVENTADSEHSPRREEYVIHPGSVAAKIRERKCRTRGGSSKPPVKRKLVQGASTSRQAVVDNAVNKGSRELLKVIDQIRAECDVLKDREEARDQEYEELKSKCEAAMADFDKNPAVNVLREKIVSLSREVKEHRANLDRMLLESQKWTGYQVSLSTLESKVASLEAEKAKLEVVEASLRQELQNAKLDRAEVSLSTLESNVASLKAEKVKLEAVEASLRQELQNAKLDRAEVVSIVVPYVTMELVNSDDIGRLVAKLVSASILFGRCHAFEKVARMKEPFDITKVKGYRYSYKQEHTRAGNELATATFPFLADVVADPHASIEALLSKTPPCVATSGSNKDSCAHFFRSILEGYSLICSNVSSITGYSCCWFSVQDTVFSSNSVKATMLVVIWLQG